MADDTRPRVHSAARKQGSLNSRPSTVSGYNAEKSKHGLSQAPMENNTNPVTTLQDDLRKRDSQAAQGSQSCNRMQDKNQQRQDHERSLVRGVSLEYNTNSQEDLGKRDSQAAQRDFSQTWTGGHRTKNEDRERRDHATASVRQRPHSAVHSERVTASTGGNKTLSSTDFEHGGARPKTQTQQATGPSVSDSNGGTKRASARKTDEHCPYIQLKIRSDRKSQDKDFKMDCDIETYMKWCYIVRSPTKLNDINTFLVKQNGCQLNMNAELCVSPSILESYLVEEELNRLVNEVIDYVGKDLVVDHVYTPKSKAVILASKLLDSPIVNVTHFLYAEASSGDKVYFVCIKTMRSEVKKQIESVCPKLCVPVRLPSVWIIMAERIKLKNRLSEMFPDLSVTFSTCKDNGDVVCDVHGNIFEVKKAVDKLIYFRDRLIWRKYELQEFMLQAVSKLKLCPILQDKIDSRYDGVCLLQEFESGILLYGCNEESIDKGINILRKCLLEKVLSLNSKWNSPRGIEELQQKLLDKYTVCMIAFVAETESLVVAGLTEDVTEAIDDLKKMIQSETENSQRSFSRKITVTDSDLFETEQLLAEEIAKINGVVLFITESTRGHSFEFTGGRQEVEKSMKEFNDAKVDLKKEEIRIDKDFADSEQGTEFLSQLQTDCHVKVVKKGSSEGPGLPGMSSTKRVTMDKQDNRCMWSFPTGRKLIIDLIDVEKCVEPDLLLVLIERKKGESGAFSKPVTLASKQSRVEVFIPKCQNKKEDERKLRDHVRRLMTKLKEDHYNSVGISLDPDGDWPFMSFLRILAISVLNFVQDFSEKSGPSTVFLCTASLNKLRQTEALIQANLDPDFDETDIQTEVLSGELNLFEADVLVNTTSPMLDLNYGKVSAAILKSAGQELQKECKKKYPKGVAGGEVAITGGHNLKCQYVFHGSLRNYRHGSQTDSLMELRTFLKNCLEKVNELNLSSIAFPVVGSGNLGFPVKEVASEMFISIEKFRQDVKEYSLRNVYFVVYHQDKDTFKIFKQVQQDIAKYPRQKTGQYQNQSPDITQTTGAQTITVTIIGKASDTEKAKKALEDKLQKLNYNACPGQQGLAKSKLAESKLPQHIHGITASQYHALIKFFPGEFEDIRDSGIEFKWQDNTIKLFGDMRKVPEAITKIKTLDQELKVMFQIHVPVSASDAEISSIVRNISQKYPEVLTIHDKILAMVHLYGKMKDVKLAGKLLGFEDEMSDKKVTVNVGASSTGLYKPTVQYEFSWTTKTRYLKVYQAHSIILKVYVGDLLESPADCIVNAANKDLHHAGGVASAIATMAGDALRKESYQISQKGPLEVGTVVETTAGNLSHRYQYILHTVGPNWYDYKPITADSLAQCEKDLFTAILNTFNKAEDMRMSSIALPAISSAIFSVPKEICAKQYARAVCDFSRRSNSSLKEIYFVDKDTTIVTIIQDAFQHMITDGLTYPVNSSVYIEEKGQQTRKSTRRSKSLNEPKELESDEKEKSSAGGMVLFEPFYVFDDEKMTCTFTTCHEIRISTGNILEFNGVDAIVCSEDKSLSARAMVAKELLRRGGKEYTDAKFEAWKRGQPLDEGDILVTIGGRNKYPWVIHALVPVRKPPEALKDLLEDILESCLRPGFKSTVMSLLGSGSGGAHPEQCSKMLLLAYKNFCKRNPGYKFILHLVNIDKAKTKVLQAVFKDYIDKQSVMRTGQRKIEIGPTPAKTQLDEKMGSLNTAQSDRFGTSTKNKGTDGNQEPDGNHRDSGNQGDSGNHSNQRTSHLKGKEKAFDDEVEDNLEDPPARNNSLEISGRKDVDRGVKEKVEEESVELTENCVICMDKLDNPKRLKCGHVFCTECIEEYFKVKQACPTCFTVCGIISGDQPDGGMEIQKLLTSVTGYEGCGSIGVSYTFQSGHQGQQHPWPGAWYKGITRIAYLPNNEEGRKICAMLKVAFERRLVFTIGTSRTTGQEGVITWNDIHHKTDHRPHTQFGYPDPTYLGRVKEELAAKGVFEEDIDQQLVTDLKKKSSFRESFDVGS